MEDNVAKKHILIILSIHILSSSLFGQSVKSNRTWTETITGFKFLHIPGWTIVMGKTYTEYGRKQIAETQHFVTIGKFWLSETEVTQTQ